MKYLFPIILIVVLFASCSDTEVCDKSVISYLNAGFKTVVDGNEKDTMMNDLTAYGIGNDTNLIYDHKNNISSVRLSFNPQTDSTSFVFVIDSVADTLTFRYDHTLVFVSYACGFTTHFTLNGISTTTNNIDSVRINNSIIIPGNEKNTTIYF